MSNGRLPARTNHFLDSEQVEGLGDISRKAGAPVSELGRRLINAYVGVRPIRPAEKPSPVENLYV